MSLNNADIRAHPFPDQRVLLLRPDCYLCTWVWEFRASKFWCKAVSRGCDSHRGMLP